MGIVWILAGIFAGYYLLVSQAFPQFSSGKREDIVPAIIYTFILTPIVTGGLVVFGMYAIQGEYDEKD